MLENILRCVDDELMVWQGLCAQMVMILTGPANESAIDRARPLASLATYSSKLWIEKAWTGVLLSGLIEVQ
jgi:hypothetical protein